MKKTGRMKIVKTLYDDAPKVPFNLDGRIMFTSPKLEIIHLSLKPGEKIDPHLQPFDLVFYLLSGNGILDAGGEPVEGRENCAIFVPAGMPRGWKNTGTDDLNLLVIKDLG
jgi:quercetin dioxygenase-like cupin family protein